MNLTIEQKEFLQHHNIPLDKVFDATGMKLNEYKSKMVSSGHQIAIGVTACRTAGHTMRNRHGKCVQCYPAVLAFQARYEKTMYLYIARSSNSALTKVGITENLEDRERQLNLHKLGGLTTWKIKYSVESSKAGRIEDYVRNILSAFNVPTPYLSKSGEICEEVYDCSYEQALQAVSAALGDRKTHTKVGV